MKEKSVVSIVKGDITESPENYTRKDLETVKAMVLKSLDLIGGLDKVVGKAKNVIVKPNLVEVPFESTGGSVVTDPRVLEAVIEILKEYGVEKVVVAEGKSVNLKHISSGPKQAFEDAGLGEIIRRAGGETLGWDEEPFVSVPNPNGEVLAEVNVPKSILDADLFINLPKLKTHGQTEVTCGIKALQGVYSVEDKVQFHTEAFPWKMVEMLRVAKPHLTIVDGLICGEHFGPIYTEPVKMDLVVSSEDVVSIDAVISEIMGIKAYEVPITRLADTEGIGNGKMENIEVRGESVDSVMKYFDRAFLWNPIGYHKNIRIFAGDAGRFTLAQLGATVRRLELEGLIDDLEEICVIVGHGAPIPVRDYKNVYVIGDSAADHPWRDRALGFIPGSPPLPSVQIVEAFKTHLKK
ncbi:MAG: DUF362 domain-containing protein [Spirochaetales bacterium]|uniref:DUF362 domain-containing protein n=1 Tax=Candidatus Thalassospirochaeta sargassi TaxID=3119039 RepID=A0AAJ1MJQ2_9SPIO|nr:DUF362 domain-containing protein [Spirochaetales bacterium]